MVKVRLYGSTYLYFFPDEEQQCSSLARYNSMVNDSSTKKAKKCLMVYMVLVPGTEAFHN